MSTEKTLDGSLGNFMQMFKEDNNLIKTMPENYKEENASQLILWD